MGNKAKYNIIIVDDHKMFRNGLRMLIEIEKIGTVIGEAENGKQFLDLLEKQKPDIVLMDIDMPIMNGIEATQKAIEKYPDLQILGLSMFGDKKFYTKMINAGAKGFIMKKSGKNELEAGIENVAMGENFFSNELLRNIMTDLGSQRTIKTQNKKNELTNQEMEILHYLCNGLSFNEIIEKTGLNETVIETHKNNLLAKTSSKNTVSLIIYALKNNLVKI